MATLMLLQILQMQGKKEKSLASVLVWHLFYLFVYLACALLKLFSKTASSR